MTLAVLDVTASELEKPPAFIKNTTLSTAGNSLVVAIDFVLKQFFKAPISPVQQLAHREELRDSLYILLIATTDKENALGILNRPSELKKYLVFNNTESTKTKILSLADASISINNSFNLTPVQLGKVYGTDLPFNEGFRFPDNANPDYLSLFVVPFINFNATDASAVVAINEVAFGKTSSELIIKGGVLNTSSLMFYKRNGSDSRPSMWVGDVHQDRRGRWRTGAIGAVLGTPPIGELLYAKKVYNTKISDNRSIERMEKKQLNFNNAKLLENASGDFALKLKTLSEVKKRTPTYISDASYSKNTQNELRFYFAIDFLNIIKENGTYSTLYSSPAELLTSCSILSFNVIRRRVKEGNIYNKLTGGDSPFRMYDNKIDIVGAPNRIDISTLNAGILHYVIADSQMDDITTGLYEYGVEIEVLDNTKDKLTSILNSLGRAIPELEDFITLSLTRGNYNGLLNRYTPGFVSELKNTYSGNLASEAPWVRAIEVYASAISLLMGPSIAKSGIGTESVIDDLLMVATPTSGTPEGLQYLVKLLKDFTSALKTAVGSSTLKKPGSAQTSETPSNRLSSKKRIFKIKQFFETPFDADSLVNMGLDFLNTSAKPVNTNNDGLRYVTTTEWLDIVNNESGKTNIMTPSGNVGFLTPNFLRLPVGSPVNLFSTDGADQQDVEKLTYQLLLANMDRNSPIIFGRSANVKMGSSIKRPAASVAVRQTAIMNSNGCTARATLQTAENPVTNMFEDVEDITPQIADHTVLGDSNALFSPNSSFARSTVNSPLISGSTDTNLLRPGTTPSDMNRGAEVRANVSLIANHLVQGDFFNGNPSTTTRPLRGSRGSNYLRNSDTNLLQYRADIDQRLRTQSSERQGSALRALYIPNSAAAAPNVSPQEIAFVNAAISGTLSPENISSNAMKYGFIYTVEYLAAYAGAAGGSAFIKKPVWTQLNAGSISNIQATGKTLLCRLSKHSTLISEFDGLQAPVYNELFIIGPRAAGAPSPLANPTSIDTPSRVQISTSVVQSVMATADTAEYSNSYDPEARVGAKPTRAQSMQQREAATHPIPRRSPEGNTTINNGHRHEYVVDQRGNGIAREVCHPDNPDVCHSHDIIRGAIQVAGSNPHLHRLISSNQKTPGAPRGTPGPGVGRPPSGGGSSTGGNGY